MAPELTCRKCGAAIPADHVHVELALARCAHCRAVLDLATRVEGLETRLGALRTPPAQVLTPRPQGLQVEEAPHRLRVRWRWFRSTHLFMLLFCTFWDGFLAFWYGSLLSRGQPLGGVGLLPLLFPVVHVAVGLGLTYATLTGLFNRTVLTVEGRQLTIRHGPIPARGNLSVHAGELVQLYCEEQPVSRRGWHMSTSWAPAAVTYSLNAVDRDGNRRVLLKGMEEAAHVRWLEQELERRLDLRDAPVAGELARPRPVA